MLCERNSYEPSTGVVVTRRTCLYKDGGRMELPDSRVRAYLPHPVQAMLHRAGLRVERVLGALADVPFSWADSPNQVYLCRRGD